MNGAPLPDFSAIFPHIPGLYLLLDPDLRIAEATDTWLRHTSMRRDQVIGRELFELLAEAPEGAQASGLPELRESLGRALRLRRPDSMLTRCYYIRRADGGLMQRYWTLLNTPACDHSGQVAFIIHRVRDVTDVALLHKDGTELHEIAREQQLLIARLRAANEELAQREYSLSESERWLSIAVEAGRLGSWDMTLPDRDMQSSALHKACFGRGPDEVFTHDDLRAAVHPDDQTRRQNALDTALSHDGDYDVEYRTIWPDGSIHWVQIRGQIIRDINRTPIRMLGVSLDVTDRKRAEELLEARVEERTRELAETNARLTAAIAERDNAERALLQAQRLEAIGQLTGGVAHDFNNLLAAVIGNLELLAARLHEDSVRRYVHAALAAAWRGGRLTQQLLAFARQQRLEPAPVDINALIAGMDILLTHSVGGLVRIQTELAADLWLASTDGPQLELVLLNLTINARDAMPDGGVLRIVTRNAAFSRAPADELEAGDYVVIAVSDTGTGMAPEVLERAFEPFFTTKEIGKGSGLGLAQAYGVARQCNGTVQLRSSPGAGTLVEVILPRATALEQTSPVIEPIPVRTALSAMAVLVLDDEPAIRSLACELLIESGHEVESADDGPGALALLHRRRFDVALVDYVLPRMSGLEFARLARQVQPDLRVLFITGNPDMLDPEQMDPRDRVLNKPYGQDDLLRALGAIWLD